jgi:hypothetical protein
MFCSKSKPMAIAMKTMVKLHIINLFRHILLKCSSVHSLLIIFYNKHRKASNYA